MRCGIKSSILLALLTINLSGCAGYYYSKSSGVMEKDLTLALLVVPENKRNLWKKKDVEFSNDDRAFPLGALPMNQENRQKVPVEIETKIFNDKRSWCGLTIWVGIPVPLWLPVCHTYTELILEDGEPVSAREQYLKKEWFICGPFMSMLESSKESLPKGFCIEDPT